MKTKTLPKGFVKCKSTECLYRLKPNKRKRVAANLELDAGKEIYIYSHYSGVYRNHIVKRNDPWLHKIENFIALGLIYHKP